MAIAGCKPTAVFGALLILCATSRLPPGDDAEIWPRWRGPRRDGSVTGSRWPEGLQGERLAQRWRIELPPSYSGPVVSNDRVFVTYTRDEKYEGVLALDRRSGEEERLQKEIDELLQQAQAVDEAEDEQHGGERRGDELPGELAHRETRLVKIREAKAALEALGSPKGGRPRSEAGRRRPNATQEPRGRDAREVGSTQFHGSRVEDHEDVESCRKNSHTRPWFS